MRLKFFVSERWKHFIPHIWGAGHVVVPEPRKLNTVYVGCEPPEGSKGITVILQRVRQAHYFEANSITGQLFRILKTRAPQECWLREAEDFGMAAYKGKLMYVDPMHYYNWRCWRLSTPRIPPEGIRRILGNYDLRWPRLIFLSNCGTANRLLPYYYDHAMCKWCGGDTAVLDLRQRVATPLLMEAVRQYGRGALLRGRDGVEILVPEDFVEDQVRHFHRKFKGGRIA